MSEANSTVPHHGFHCEGDVCYRTLDFLGFPGYRVGDDGDLWSQWEYHYPKGEGRGRKYRIGNTWKKIDHQKDKRPGEGYERAQLRKDKKTTKIGIHRLVLLAFVGPCPPSMEACHNDGSRDNNHVENLRWATHKSNQQDRHRHGTTPHGERSGNSKLTNANVLAIRAGRANGKSVATLAATFGVAIPTVYGVVRNKAWKHLL